MEDVFLVPGIIRVLEIKDCARYCIFKVIVLLMSPSLATAIMSLSSQVSLEHLHRAVVLRVWLLRGPLTLSEG